MFFVLYLALLILEYAIASSDVKSDSFLDNPISSFIVIISRDLVDFDSFDQT